MIKHEDQGLFTDIGCILVILGSTAGEKIHLIGKNFAAIAFDFIGIFPLRIMQAPFDRNHLALGTILGNVFAKTVEASDTVEFCIFDRKAFFILVGLAFTVAGWPIGAPKGNQLCPGGAGST